MNNYIPPSEYYTFDAIVNDPIEVVEAVLASKAGDHTDIKKLANGVVEIDELPRGNQLQSTPPPCYSCLYGLGPVQDSSKSLDGERIKGKIR